MRAVRVALLLARAIASATRTSARSAVEVQLEGAIAETAMNNQEVAVKYAVPYELGAIAQLGERRAGSAKVEGSSPSSSISEGMPSWIALVWRSVLPEQTTKKSV